MQRLLEQSYLKGPQYITCPAAYLERLFLRNYSLSTIRTYHSLLLRFLNGYADRGKEATDAFTAEDINHYHRGMVQAGKYSHSLINQSINAVKFYYHQVLSRPDLQLNKVERPEKADRLPLVLSKEEVQKILQGTENLKHRCLLQLLYAGGLWIGELINLRITDDQSERNLLLIRGGKGKKDRTTLLSGKLLELLREYNKAYRPKVWPRNASGFDNSLRGRMGGSTPFPAPEVFKACLKKAGIKKKATPHSLRHSGVYPEEFRGDLSFGTGGGPALYPGPAWAPL